MSNQIKREINKIKVPKEVSERSKLGVEMANSNPKFLKKRRWSNGLTLAAALLLKFTGFIFYQNKTNLIQNDVMNGEVIIPTINLSTDNDSAARMMALIVYNKKVYIRSNTTISAEDAEVLLGDELGQTKANIDEWSTQNEYEVGLASTIDEGYEVYTVKNYDKEFRIMTYITHNDRVDAQFYESLNVITIQSGADVFGKLNLVGNIVNVQHQNYSDYNNDTGRYYPLKNNSKIESFVEALNETVPVETEEAEEVLGDYYNDDEYKQLIFELEDSLQVRITLIKEGYVRYGNTEVYFKMNDNIFKEVWKKL